MRNIRKTINIEYKKLKKICEITKDSSSIHQWLDYFYHRISNKKISIEEAQRYNLFDIVENGKEIKRFGFETSNNVNIIFEFYKYTPAPKSFLLIYNSFIGEQQKEIDFYVLKGEENGKENND